MSLGRIKPRGRLASKELFKRGKRIQIDKPIRIHSFPDIGWQIPTIHPPCPHLHFRAPIYERDILTSAQHMYLLATPKGYRWHGDSQSDLRNRAYGGRPGKKRLQPIKMKPCRDTLIQFMAKIWDLFTPEMLIQLKEILMEEFGMCDKLAREFLIQQKARTYQMVRDEVCGPCDNITEEDVDWAREMADIFAFKVTSFAEMMTRKPRDSRTKRLKDAIYKGLHRLSETDPDKDTPLKGYWDSLSMGLAVWLSNMPGERNLRKICADLLRTCTPPVH